MRGHSRPDTAACRVPPQRASRTGAVWRPSHISSAARARSRAARGSRRGWRLAARLEGCAPRRSAPRCPRRVHGAAPALRALCLLGAIASRSRIQVCTAPGAPGKRQSAEGLIRRVKGVGTAQAGRTMSKRDAAPEAPDSSAKKRACRASKMKVSRRAAVGSRVSGCFARYGAGWGGCAAPEPALPLSCGAADCSAAAGVSGGARSFARTGRVRACLRVVGAPWERDLPCGPRSRQMGRPVVETATCVPWAVGAV